MIRIRIPLEIEAEDNADIEKLLSWLCGVIQNIDFSEIPCGTKKEFRILNHSIRQIPGK